MKRITVSVSLAIALASPFALSQIAVAQSGSANTMLAQRVAHNDSALASYSYFDAMVLANFWGTSIEEAKSLIDTKLRAGYDSKAFLSLTLADARASALENAQFLKLFIDSGFTYKDAQDLASFWGDGDVRQAKLRVERNLALGNYEGIQHILKLAQRR